MRIAWLTDVHLNFLAPEVVRDFLVQLNDTGAEAFLISGDIGEAHSVTTFLEQIDEAVRRPIYFVLGNHDFYFGSIAHVRQSTIELCRQRPRLHYLTHSGWHPLTAKTAVVGHDGWADAREGDYMRSYVAMSDYRLIAELAHLNKASRWPILQRLGDESAAHIHTHLPRALEKHEHAILVTHVPPLRNACWYDGQISDDEWSPHFTCQAVGCAMLEIMKQHPDRRLTVFCGHTHGCGETQPLPNVMVYTGGAEYGHPTVARIFEVE